MLGLTRAVTASVLHGFCLVMLSIQLWTPALAMGNASAGQTSAPMSVPALVRTCTPTVVTIITKDVQGSGVIVSSEGVIATNLHVIRGASKVSVRLANGDVYDDAAVVDVDARKDLALLRVKAFGLRPAVFGSSDRVEVGERVVAIGSPRGLDTTVSEGIVSAIRDTGDGYRVFQTTAPI